MQHLVDGEIGHPHGPVTEFPVKTVWALLDLKVAKDQRSWRRCRCFRRFVKRYPHQTRQAFAVRVQRPAARRAETDGFWQYFHGAPYSPASTRNNQCNSPSTSASVSTVRRTGIKAVASANRSTARRNAQMAARRRSHRSVPLIQRNRALELRSTPARHPGPHRHEAPDDAGPPDAQLSAPVLHLSAP